MNMPSSTGRLRELSGLERREPIIMTTAVWIAFALLLLLEGLPLLLAPSQWREVVKRVSSLADGQLRFFGLLMVLTAAGVLLFAARG
jgi:uncharacterized protein YjeT (DUF2065 family)